MTPDGRLKVVHVTQYLEIGGLESFIVEFCKQTDTQAFEAGVLCLNGYDESYRRSLEQCSIVVDLVKKRSKYDLSFFFRAAALLRSRKTDILHAHGGCFLYSTVIGKLAGVRRIIYTMHGMPVTTGCKARAEEFLSCLLADKIIAVSQEIAADLKSRVPCFSNKIEVIINGINHLTYSPCNDLKLLRETRQRYGLPETGKIIGSVGRLEKVKNYPLLLRAFADFVHSYGNEGAHLVLVGSGREDALLKDLARQLSVDTRVSFLGMQYNLPEIYPLFDLFVLPSLTEGTSLSLLEAQSCGIPAIVTDVGENGTIIRDGVNGYLCQSGDAAGMAEKLHRLMNDAEEMSRMKQASREVILQRFDIASMMRTYRHVYVD